MKPPVTFSETAPARSQTRPKLGLVVLLALLSVGLTGCFRVSSDTKALRDGLMQTAAAEWDTEIEVGVGTLTLGLARLGLGFVDLPPEARAAIGAVRGAEVGVYRLRDEHRPLDHSIMLTKADGAMGVRGWDRLVTVLNHREMVAIYVPKDMRSPRDVSVSIVVLDGHDMVLAAARSDLEPLMQIAFKRPEWQQVSRPRAEL